MKALSLVALEALRLPQPMHIVSLSQNSFANKFVYSDLASMIKKDLSGKLDEIVEFIVADVEKSLTDKGIIKASFLQNNLKTSAKKLIKDVVMQLLRHMVPLFERWIAEAVKPPVSGPVVYNALVKPVTSSIFDEINDRLKITRDHSIWDDNRTTDDDEDENEDDILGEFDVE